MKIESLELSPVKPTKLRISWKFSLTMENFQDFQFTLERSEHPEDGFTPIFVFNHEVEFLDAVEYKRLWKTLYYRIKIVNVQSGHTSYSHTAYMPHIPNLEAIEITRRNDILLRNKRHGTGVPVAVFSPKKLGPACECWDSDKQRLRTSNCPYCYGSHIEGGYYSPIITWANLTPNAKAIQLPQWGEMEQNEKRMFFSNYPVIQPKDLILDAANMVVYSVERVETSERRGTLLHQIVSAYYLDGSHAAYNLVETHAQLINDLRTESFKIKKS